MERTLLIRSVNVASTFEEVIGSSQSFLRDSSIPLGNPCEQITGKITRATVILCFDETKLFFASNTEGRELVTEAMLKLEKKKIS